MTEQKTSDEHQLAQATWLQAAREEILTEPVNGGASYRKVIGELTDHEHLFFKVSMEFANQSLGVARECDECALYAHLTFQVLIDRVECRLPNLSFHPDFAVLCS